MKTIDFENLGINFGNGVVKAHKTKTLYSGATHRALSDIFLKTGLDAGSLVASINTAKDLYSRYEQVKECIKLVEKATYLALVMESEGVYKRRPLKNLYKLSEACIDLLNEEYDELVVALNKKSASYTTKVKAQPVIKKVAPKAVVVKDDDGFEDVYNEDEFED